MERSPSRRCTSASAFSLPVTSHRTSRDRFDDRKGQGHAAPALVGGGHRDIRIVDVEDRIAGNQRCGMAIRPEAEMNEVKHRRRARHVPQRQSILLRRTAKLRCFNRHRVQVIGRERHTIEQALTEMSEISIGIACRSNPLVHLKDMHLAPGQLAARQCSQHQPGRTAAADRHDEASARCHRDARGISDNRRRRDDLPLWPARIDVCVQPAPFSRWPPNS